MLFGSWEKALGGIINQPRFFKNNSLSFNPAGDMLDELHSFILQIIDALVKISRAEEPGEPEEVEAKAWVDLIYEAECSDSLPGLCGDRRETCRGSGRS